MIRLNIVFWLLVNCALTHAQIDPALLVLENYTEEMESTYKTLSFATKSSQKHNLYVDGEWQHSFIVGTENQITHFNGRYNVLNKSIELTYKGQVRTINSDKIRYAKIGQHIFAPFQTSEGSEYFEILSNGSVSLLLKYDLSEKMTSSNALVSQVVGETSYASQEELYFKKGNKIEKLKSSKKKVLELFDDHTGEIESFADERKTRFGRKEDLIRVFNFYNGLNENIAESP